MTDHPTRTQERFPALPGGDRDEWTCSAGGRSRRGKKGATAVILLAQSTSIFDPASPPAESIRSLSVLVLAITGFIFIAVEGILIYSIVRFRRNRQVANLPDATNGAEEPPQV